MPSNVGGYTHRMPTKIDTYQVPVVKFFDRHRKLTTNFDTQRMSGGRTKCQRFPSGGGKENAPNKLQLYVRLGTSEIDGDRFVWKKFGKFDPYELLSNDPLLAKNSI